LVLVADPDEARGKATALAIESWGLASLLVHDGVEAMLVIQRTLPAAIVLDAGLPKMFGFQICEVVKRNESLRDTKVVLVGAIHHQDRYRRDPSDLYGADVYIESPDLPEGLLPLLRDAGLSVPDEGADRPVSPKPPVEPAASPEPIPEPAAESIPEPTPELDPSADITSQGVATPAPSSEPAVVDTAEDPERTAERERAQRLARIAVSEMVLYQPEKFDQATLDGTLEQTLDLEIQEARALLRQRIGEEVRAETDFIIDELNRVAQERGGQG
jgi:CheY-like chemotaxis protein